MKPRSSALFVAVAACPSPPGVEVFEGTLPYGDCAGIDTRLLLQPDGAYSLAQASQYNGRFLPAVVLIGVYGQAKLIRGRETFADLTANDV